MGAVFALLARLRFLRGTPLDVFGYTQERRADRALLAQYEDVITRLLARLASGERALALRIAGFPESVRGFGHVRAAALQKVQPQLAQWLDAWEARRE